jgi:hypothetical protein
MPLPRNGVVLVSDQGQDMTTAISFERPPDAQSLLPHLEYAAALDLPFVQKDSHVGQKALICSTGPSLKNKSTLRRVKALAKSHVVFALKESIPFLKSKGVKVSYTVAMDPGGERQITRTPIDTDVTYCIASSCNPKLYDHILGNGCKIEVFHSACGEMQPAYEPGMRFDCSDTQSALIEGVHVLNTMDDGAQFCPLVPILKTELQLYGEIFGEDKVATMCGGFTVTNRALALAKYMGFDKVVMAGTDFGWRKEGGSHYCDLVKVAANDDNYMTDQGLIDGKPWFTRPDQLASAQDVARKIKANEVTIIGDSLALALSKHTDEFLDDIVRLE